MLDTDNACVLAGMAAIGAIVWSRNQDQMYFRPYAATATPCSAMKASIEEEEEGILAMKSDVEPTSSDTGELYDNLFPSVSKEFEEQYENASTTPAGGFYSDKVQKTLKELRPKFHVESNFASVLGNSVPVAGREFDHFKPKKIKVEGGCMLYQTEAYAEQIEAQKNGEESSQ